MKNCWPLLGLTAAAAACGVEKQTDTVDLARTGEAQQAERQVGRERAIPTHTLDGDELTLPIDTLVQRGRKLMSAVWTDQDGAGRPLSKGSGDALSDPASPLVFPRNFNRISGPEANSCGGCHDSPFGIVGGGGDIVNNVFFKGDRFDFATFDEADTTATRGGSDERGQAVTLESIANSRATLGMWGSGFIEMLARQMTADLQALRDAVPPGGTSTLSSKGVFFGTLARTEDGSWDVSGVEGLPGASLLTTSASDPPSLILRPFHQSGHVISLRDFTNTALNEHHGMQSTERFGKDTDPDGDGHVNEITRADVTSLVIMQATMQVPGRVIPNDAVIEAANLRGEELFDTVGCDVCHMESLPLDSDGWIFVEPNPYNPPGNLQTGEVADVTVDLTSTTLPLPRLAVKNGVVKVPAYTDLKLHDITTGPGDPNEERLDTQQVPGSSGFFAGNRRFLTKKLWGCANEQPYFHHGKFTTLRESIQAHHGEAEAQNVAFNALPAEDQAALIEFLKSLQVLPQGARKLVIDETGRGKRWPPVVTPTPDAGATPEPAVPDAGPPDPTPAP